MRRGTGYASGALVLSATLAGSRDACWTRGGLVGGRTSQWSGVR